MEDKKTISQNCGIRCRQIRMSKGISQQELADKMHVTAAAVSKWEKEGISNIDVISELSNVLGQDITADQIDQEGSIGEIGKHILGLLVDKNGYIDYKDLVSKMFSMDTNHINNEVFKLERIGTLIREQFKDFNGSDRDGLFITAKGAIAYHQITEKPIGKIITYDSFMDENTHSFQDKVNNDVVTYELSRLGIEGLGFRCDYLNYLYRNHFNPIVPHEFRDTWNGDTFRKYLIDNEIWQLDLRSNGPNVYIDIIQRMAQGTNRKEMDYLIEGSLITTNERLQNIKENREINEKGYDVFTFEATNYFCEKFPEFEEKELIAVDYYAKDRWHYEFGKLGDNEHYFYKSLSKEKLYNCSTWFSDEEIKAFIEDNFLPPETKIEHKINDTLHKIWEADKSTLDYYKFPMDWEFNGLASLLRERLGIPQDDFLTKLYKDNMEIYDEELKYFNCTEEMRKCFSKHKYRTVRDVFYNKSNIPDKYVTEIKIQAGSKLLHVSSYVDEHKRKSNKK